MQPKPWRVKNYERKSKDLERPKPLTNNDAKSMIDVENYICKIGENRYEEERHESCSSGFGFFCIFQHCCICTGVGEDRI
jgi:hypothetical protein